MYGDWDDGVYEILHFGLGEQLGRVDRSWEIRCVEVGCLHSKKCTKAHKTIMVGIRASQQIESVILTS